MLLLISEIKMANVWNDIHGQAVREMKIKVTVRCHFSLIPLAKLKSALELGRRYKIFSWITGRNVNCKNIFGMLSDNILSPCKNILNTAVSMILVMYVRARSCSAQTGTLQRLPFLSKWKPKSLFAQHGRVSSLPISCFSVLAASGGPCGGLFSGPLPLFSFSPGPFFPEKTFRPLHSIHRYIPNFL